MKILCYDCGQKYNIDETKIKGQTVHVKCKKCGFTIKVNKPDTIANTSFFEEPVQGNGSREMGSTGDSLPVDEKLDMPGLSIRAKIIVTMVALVFVSLTVVGSISTFKISEILSGQVERLLLNNSRQKAKEYSLLFKRVLADSQSVADYSSGIYDRDDMTSDIKFEILMPWNGTGYGLDSVSEKTESEICFLQHIGLYITGFVKNNPYLSWGYLTTETGLAVFNEESTVQRIEDKDAYIPNQQPGYQRAKQAGHSIWTKPYVHAITKKRVITCATPVYEFSGLFVGVVGLDLSLDMIQRDLQNMDIGYDSYVFITDSDGQVFVRPKIKATDTRWDKTWETEDLIQTSNTEFNSIIQKMITGWGGLDTYFSEKNERYIASSPLEGMDGNVAIVAIKDLIIKPAKDIQKLFIIIACVVLLISLLTGFFLGNSITKPLVKLTLLTNRYTMEQSEFEVKDVEGRQDEIGSLAKSIKRLVIHLKSAIKR